MFTAYARQAKIMLKYNEEDVEVRFTGSKYGQ
jgi:hypothetical protein